MSTISLSEVKARLSELADEVYRTHQRLSVTRNGREYVVIMAAEDLESLEATIELLGDPEAQTRITAAEAEVARGDVVAEEDVRALIAERRRSGR